MIITQSLRVSLFPNSSGCFRALSERWSQWLNSVIVDGDPYDQRIRDAIQNVSQGVVQIRRPSASSESPSSNNPLISGLIWNSAGLICTKAQAIAQAQTVEVILSNHQVLEAKVVGIDAEMDIAFIQVPYQFLPTVPTALITDQQSPAPNWVAILESSGGLTHMIAEGYWQPSQASDTPQDHESDPHKNNPYNSQIAILPQGKDSIQGERSQRFRHDAHTKTYGRSHRLGKTDRLFFVVNDQAKMVGILPANTIGTDPLVPMIGIEQIQQKMTRLGIVKDPFSALVVSQDA